ncbi:major facilitator superfamily protein [Lineolata rhizophorae]|uniref:Major facilitator superfamily protein n=1 Tax=Lineolata rhizophorae TaxID=578093 RepID=A0A6A6NRE0_9PEZI|nr:major facilitator superfamily protein [Lineolata rhizophorae]
MSPPHHQPHREDTKSSSSPTETSPLLSKQDHDPHVPHLPVDPGAGLAPEGADANGSYDYDEEAAVGSSNSTSGDDEEDGHRGDIDRTTSHDGRLRQYQGMPEVRKRLKYIVPALAIGVFLAAADQTIIVSSYGKIGTDLKALNKTSWIATAYFLTLTSFQPLYGKLSDIFSRKACLLFAYLVFGTGCLFCGLARNIGELIAARAFAGLGGGGMTTVVSILLSDVVPLRERGTWQGYINIVYAAGSGAGAPLGGILADSISWRWSFLLQFPLCLVAFVAVGLALNMPKKEDSHWREKLKRIDFVGALVLVAAVFALLLGLDRGSNVSWRDRYTLAALCTSVPLFAIFVFVEVKIAAEPFAPGHIIFERSLFACYLCNFFSFGGWLAAIFYIPLYFQAVDKLSATQAGVRLIPCIVAGVSGSLFGGFYMQRTGRYYWITVLTYSSLTVGMAIILLSSGAVPALRSTPAFLVGMCVCGFSNGVGVTTSLIGLIANAAHADQAVATACSYLFRSLGSVTGVSLSATVANQVLRTSLHGALESNGDAERIAEGVRQSLEFVKTLEPALRELVKECYARSTRAAFGLETAVVAGAAVSAWWVRERKLSHD